MESSNAEVSKAKDEAREILHRINKTLEGTGSKMSIPGLKPTNKEQK